MNDPEETTPLVSEDNAAQELAEAQAAKDRELLAKLQAKAGQMEMVKPIRPNRAMRRLARRHLNRTWTFPMTDRAKRERRALARAGIFVRNHPVEA